MIKVYKSCTIRPRGKKNEVRFAVGEYGDDMPPAWKEALAEVGALDDPDRVADEEAKAAERDRQAKAAAATAAEAVRAEVLTPTAPQPLAEEPTPSAFADETEE